MGWCAGKVRTPSWSRGVSQGEAGPLGRSGVVGWKACVGSNRSMHDLLLEVMDEVSDGGNAVRVFLFGPVLACGGTAGCLAEDLMAGVPTEAVRLKESKMSPRFWGMRVGSPAVARPGLLGGGVWGGADEVARSLIFGAIERGPPRW